MDFNEIKKAVASEAQRLGIKEYELYYVQDSSMSAETLKHEISSFSSAVSGGVCFRCVVGGKMGYASSELMEVEEIKSLVSRAASNAEYVEATDNGVIFKGSPKYEKINAKLPQFFDAAEMKEIALNIENDIYKSSDKVMDGSSAGVGSSETYIRLFNSYGLDLENHVGANYAVASGFVNVDGEVKNDYDVKFGDDKNAFQGMADKVVKSALEQIGGGTVETGVYNVIIDKRQMCSLLSAYSSVFSAKCAQDGMSLLADKEGKVIASECVTITDDPFRKGYALQTHFDAEGVATFRKNVVEKGVFKTLLHNLSTAKKAGVETTANASKAGYSGNVGVSPYCLCIEGSDISEEELFKMADSGVYVTEVKGLHAGVNAVTGDFSIECSGFMIKDGKKDRPIKSFTIAGNFFELLKNIDAVSNEVKVGLGSFTAFGSPCVLVHGISVAG